MKLSWYFNNEDNKLFTACFLKRLVEYKAEKMIEKVYSHYIPG